MDKINPVTGEVEQADEPQRLTLSSLGNGGAEELFQRHLDAVLANIADLETDATAKREITLKVTIIPGRERDELTYEVAAGHKLAPLNGAFGKATLGLVMGKNVAVPYTPKMPLFEEQAPKLAPVPKQAAGQ